MQLQCTQIQAQKSFTIFHVLLLFFFSMWNFSGDWVWICVRCNCNLSQLNYAKLIKFYIIYPILIILSTHTKMYNILLKKPLHYFCHFFQVPNTEGPCLTWILGLEKKRVTQIWRKWDCSKDSTNAKFPHLHIHKLKPWKWGTVLVIFSQVGDPLYHVKGGTPLVWDVSYGSPR